MKRIVLNLLVAAGILLLLEGACQLEENPPKYRRSELLGYELIPGARLEDETVNAAGLRGPEVRPRAATSLRILCMGGSTTWGHKVADDETWPAYLQRELAAAGWPDVEVLNGGVSGYGLEQIVLALETRRIAELQPDLVLVYEGWNFATIQDNTTVARHMRDGADAPPKSLLHHSAFVRWLDDKVEDVRALAAAPTTERFDRRLQIRTIMEQVFPGFCVRLATLARERGTPIAMVRYPGLMQVPPAPGAEPDRRYEKRLNIGVNAARSWDELVSDGVLQWQSGADIVVASATAAGLPLLDVAGDMLAALDGLSPEERRTQWVGYFRDRMHPEPEGNQAIARSVAKLLVEQGLLPAASH